MKQYFVTDYYHPAGRPRMEDNLMSRAITLYLHCIVVNLNEMVSFMQKAQEILWEQNKRIKKVTISYHHGHEGHVLFCIGACHLSLQEIRNPQPLNRINV